MVSFSIVMITIGKAEMIGDRFDSKTVGRGFEASCSARKKHMQSQVI